MLSISTIKWLTLIVIACLAVVSIANAQEAEAAADMAKENPKSMAINGFVVWAEGSGCDRELKFNKLVAGKVGEKQTAVKMGVAADIHVHISYDGVWIAFSRATQRWQGKYGGCDYHDFDNFDIYIAKIDNGKNLPAQAIRVDHGYWSSWGDDAKDPDGPKTLYYTRYSDQTIRKAVIAPDGTIVSKDEVHATCPKKVTGSGAHTQGSPDGKYIAYRPNGIQVAEVSTGNHVEGAGGGGCHPCWGPRSKYLIWSKNNVCRIDGSSARNLGEAGVGSYWQGISNDAYYDEGRLWIIGRVSGGKDQNAAGSVEFREVDITNGGWVLGPTTKVGEGTTADMHVYRD